jgi:Holliday junction DNA helicase RuvA
MITKLAGRVVGLEIGSIASAEVEPGDGRTGVTYLVLLPRYLAERLSGQVDGAGSAGVALTLHTRQDLESVNQGASYQPRLIGFGSAVERAFFEVFTSVKGLGPKKALRALAVEPSAIAAMVEAKDVRGLKQLPEIGARLAETIVAELHGKLGAFALGAEDRGSLDRAASGSAMGVVEARGGSRRGTGGASGPVGEAVDALVALGEGRGEAERRVERAMARRPELTGSRAEEIVAAALGG